MTLVVWLVRPGRTLTADWLDLGYAAAAPVGGADPGGSANPAHACWVRLQVGVPGPLDMAAFSWVTPWVTTDRIEVDAALRKVVAIEAFTGATAVYQVELPVETYLVAGAPRRVTLPATVRVSAVLAHAGADLRVDYKALQYERIEPPASVAAGILEYCVKLSLTYGALDFVIRPDGNWVFLECNAGGQYGWIEDAIDAPITEALADLLEKGIAT